MARSFSTIYIGTSGWSYNHWRGPFYPEDLRSEQWLQYYAEHFKSAEINNSFYHLPEKKTLKHWHDTVPEDFVFSAKASRYMTHMKKLKDAHDSINTFVERISILGDKLGPILFQLPPHWRFNGERLAAFLNTLSTEFRYTFEFRDPDWLNSETYDLLSEHQVAFCIYELNGFLSPKKVTADFVYIRLHGPNGPYQGSYDNRALAGWTGALSTWAGQGKQIYCYFDNDESGYAAQNALSLQSMLQD